MILLALSEGILEKLKPLLERHKIKYEVVSSGEEVLERARKVRPELIILEKDLPLLDGFATILLLKNDIKTKDIPVIALCKCDYPEEEIKAKDSGADDLLRYPLKEEEVKAVLKRYLKLKE